jgi:hypothetical protein
MMFLLSLLPLVLAATAAAAFNAPEAATATQIRFAHWAPFASALSDSAVTFRVEGVDVATNLKYGENSDYVTLNGPGEYTIELVHKGTVVATQVATLDDGSYSVVSAGENGILAIELFVLQDVTTPPPAARTALRFAHLAPFAATKEESLVDVCTDDNVPFDKSSNSLAYKRTTVSKEVRATTYNLKITKANTTAPCTGERLLDLPLLTFKGGQIRTLYIVGNDIGYATFGVFSFEDGFTPEFDLVATDFVYLPLGLSD